MENYKAQGTMADAVSELTVPLKMLELAKFREAALMSEQYLRSNPEDGKGYLLLYAARVQNASLCRLTPSSVPTENEVKNFALFVEHGAHLSDFFRYAEREDAATMASYMRSYLYRAIRETQRENLVRPKEEIFDLFQSVLNATFSYDRDEFAPLSFALGEYMLKHRAFDEASDLFANAKGDKVDEGERLLRLLFAAMQITDESEFGTCERFSVEMPEYINLLLALGDQPKQMDRIVALAEENERSRGAVVERREKEERERIYRTYVKQKKQNGGVPSKLVFYGLFAFSIVYFLFFFDSGAVWNLFGQLTPFGREDAVGSLRASLITSTVILGLENLIFIMAVVGIATEETFANTVRKVALLISTQFFAAFGAWYLMYAYAHWFSEWDGFLAVLVSIPLALVVSAVLLFAVVGFFDHFKSIFNMRMQSVRGRLWTRGFNGMLLAIPFLSFGAFIHHTAKLVTMDMIVMAFFVGVGAYFFVRGVVSKIRTIFLMRALTEISDPNEEREMASTEYASGVIMLVLAVLLVFAFLSLGFPWSLHIALDALLLLCGVFSVIVGTMAIKKLDTEPTEQ